MSGETREPGREPEGETLHVWGMGDFQDVRPKRPGSRLSLDRIFRAALFFVPFGVLVNLALSWYATDRSVFATLDERPRRFLYLAMALALIPWLTNALRLLIWTRFMGHRMAYREAFRITLGADLAAALFPNSVREVIRWGMMVQTGITRSQAATIVSLGYLEDLAFFALALPAAFVVSRAWRLPVLQGLGGEVRGGVLWVFGGVALAVAALWLGWWLLLRGALGARIRGRGLRFTARTRRRARRSWREFREVWTLVVARGKTRFGVTFLITSIQWACRYSVLTALCSFLGAPVDPVLSFLLQWVIFTTLLFIPTPGAAGGAEASFFLVYSALLPAGVIGIATAGWRLLTFYFQLSLGAVLFAGLNLADARARRRAAPRRQG
ncbi:MAG TPA: lysylphosphatidylglycerol synthase transmembrane domain-containing protein [Longimicrobiaceae bacterium]|nr:lysylphosphatidylglycerol synthase transmembrane domain-containing protein [Longimicrobiaceae bacterium]